MSGRVSARSPCSPSIPARRSPRARCSATASGSPSTSSTPASSSARWPTAARSAACPRRRSRRPRSWTAPAATTSSSRPSASGSDDVFLETVGVGQAEVDIIDHADTIVLVLMPGSGDSIQALKAGVMEIPDVIVVNKSDHPLTDTMIREVRGVLSLGPQHGWRVPIVKAEASRGEGSEELAEKIHEHHAFIEAEGTLAERRRRNLMNEVLALAAARLRRQLEEQVREDPSVQELLDEVVARRLDPASAAAKLLEREL